MTRLICARLAAANSLAVLGLILSGCVTERVTQPNVVALPAQGEPFEVFQQHDDTCRHYAAAQTGGQSPGQAAASTVSGAAVGTGIGAAAGALLGSASGHAGNGAAIGAGTGLLAGSLLGGASGGKAAESTQAHYDAAYTQCMVGNGERMANPKPAASPIILRPTPTVIYVPVLPAVATP